MAKFKLRKTVQRSKKRVGRGIGSGKGGHTSGRGQKGQRARGHINVLFEGVKTKKSLLKRLPLMRGKGKFHAKGKPVIITVTDLEKLPTGSVITMELLVKEKIVDKTAAENYGVKVLGGGKSTKKFTYKVPTSRSVFTPEKTAEKAVEKKKVEEKPIKVAKAVKEIKSVKSSKKSSK
jgi:large subunit ribosomal protein L15